MARHMRSRVSRGKVLLTLAVVAVGATAIGAGTYSSFTATATPASPLTVSSGTESLTIPAAGAANRMTVNASGLVPGDTIQRAVDLSNNGTEDLSAITLTTTASPSSLLDTNATYGLQLVIDKCGGTGWTEAGSSPAYTYTCSGGSTPVLATRAVIGSAISLSSLSALTHGATDHLRVLLTFPSGADDTYQNKTSTITFTFNGTQRANSAH
jgi:spore coat-associated protein N